MKKTITYKEVKDKVLELINGGVSPTPTPTEVRPFNYSADEKEVGTWLDGSKVYQKTYTFNTPTASSWNNNIDISSLNIGEGVNIFTMMYYSNNTVFCGNNEKYGMALFNENYDDLTLYFTHNETCTKAIVTIQYTKGV